MKWTEGVLIVLAFPGDSLDLTRVKQTLGTAEQREKLWSLLGRLPDRDRPIGVRVLAEVQHGNAYLMQRLELDLNCIEPVPAYFLRPTNSSNAKLPVVLYHHSHGGGYEIGKKELVTGREYMQPTPYAIELTQAGYAVLAIDCWNFGDRHCRSESSLFKEMLWNGQVLWGMMMFDAVRALDYLCTRPDVDTARIATMGMSMGATLAWWLAALDDRVACCVDICCLTDFAELVEDRALDEHGLYYYVPDLLSHFSTSSIAELIAARPHLALAGDLDPLTPAAGLDRVDRHLREVYGAAGAPENWKLFRQPVAHQETPEMREQTMLWLKRCLV